MCFEPYCILAEEGVHGTFKGMYAKGRTVCGEVVYINRRHNWYRLRYRVQGAQVDCYECLPIRQEPVAEPHDAPRRAYEGIHIVRYARKPKANAQQRN